MSIMNFKDIIKQSILENFTSNITPEKVIIVLLASLIFGVYIFFVYRATINNEFYSKDFNRVLTLMTVVTAGVVLAISANIVISLGMVGALSIVRFRTAVKSPMDLLFLFWAISVGIITGAGLYLLACVLCLIVTIAIYVLSLLSSPTSLGLLVVRCNNLEVCETADKLIREYTKFARIKNRTVSKNSVEIIYEIKTKNETALETALSNIAEINEFAFMNFDRETRI